MFNYPDNYISSRDPYQQASVSEACPDEVDRIVEIENIRRATLLAYCEACRVNGIEAGINDLEELDATLTQGTTLALILEENTKSIKDQGYEWNDEQDGSDPVGNIARRCLGLDVPDLKKRRIDYAREITERAKKYAAEMGRS